MAHDCISVIISSLLLAITIGAKELLNLHVLVLVDGNYPLLVTVIGLRSAVDSSNSP